jgi:hypothetical protein
MKTITTAGVLVFALLSPLTAARADVVTDWNDIGATTSVNALPAERGFSSLDLSLVHIAMFDAINAISPRYRAYVAQVGVATQGASPDAAAATAAYNVLRNYFPSRAAALDAAYATSLAAIPDGIAKTLGIAVGNDVAQDVVLWRLNDGRYATVPYAFGSGPGVYQRTIPGPPGPVNTWVPGLRPLVLQSLGQFRAYGPPGLKSETYTRDYNETKLLGSAGSTTRTAEQSEIGLFHTENPNFFWARNLRSFTAGLGLDLLDHSRLMAMLFVAYNDAIGTCFDSKYTYNFWRPVTAIQAGDSDDNANTAPDASWAPFVTTPPHPEYPAAHGCAAGAVTGVIRHEVGRHTELNFTSTVSGTIPHHFDSPDGLVTEIINARVYGGMHYRNSGEHGVRLGRKVADVVTDHYFRPLRPRHHED